MPKCFLFIFGMEIAPMENMYCVWHQLLYLIKYVHNDLIKDLYLFHIPEAIFNSRAIKVDKNAVISVTFDISSILF